MNSISTFDITKIPLLDLLRDTQQGKIQLVDFQRSWCWNEDRISRALASVSLGFPIGVVMFLKQGNPKIKFKPRLVESVVINETPIPKYLILDGQQRLTSLLMALLSGKPVSIDLGKRHPPEERWFYLDIKLALDYPNTPRRDAIFSLKTDKKLRQPGQPTIDYSSPEKEYEMGFFPVSQTFNFPQWRSGYCKYWKYAPDKLAVVEQFEAEVIKKFEHYQMGVFVLSEELPKEAVCYIFEENKKPQCELTYFDLLTSSYAATEFDLRSDWALREQHLAQFKVLRLLKNTDFLQAIVLSSSYARRLKALNQGCPTEKLPGVTFHREEVLNLDLEEYLQWASSITKGFESAARFLHNQD